MITDRVGLRQPTKQRLLQEGVRLFAEKGFRETTVGDVEAAAGLEPRRGALYRHFQSKEALLEAALEQHMQYLGETTAGLDQLPVKDQRQEALIMGQWLLAELDRERAIVRILEQDGDRLTDLRDRFRQVLIDPGYELTSELARRWLGSAADQLDLQALSAVLLGSLVNYRRSTWTFGATPAGLDDERFLATWADLCVTTAAALRRKHSKRPTRVGTSTRPAPKQSQSRR
ncbi:MAG TPA: TetR/AcrR family transcriptional regulator [Acidimicrobiales bacterium]